MRGSTVKAKCKPRIKGCDSCMIDLQQNVSPNLQYIYKEILQIRVYGLFHTEAFLKLILLESYLLTMLKPYNNIQLIWYNSYSIHVSVLYIHTRVHNIIQTGTKYTYIRTVQILCLKYNTLYTIHYTLYINGRVYKFLTRKKTECVITDL